MNSGVQIRSRFSRKRPLFLQDGNKSSWERTGAPNAAPVSKGKRRSSMATAMILGSCLFIGLLFLVMYVTLTENLDNKSIIHVRVHSNEDSRGKQMRGAGVPKQGMGSSIESSSGGGGPSSSSSHLTMYGSHRVQPSMSNLPTWLQDYFKWHHNETQHGSKETKYIILPCLGSDKCGGFSDRLRTLPFFLLIASRTNRVLCIHWHRPFGLEDFFEPPEGGVDWRCPGEYIESVKGVRISGGQKNRHLMSFGVRKVPIVESAELAIKEMNEKFNEGAVDNISLL